jgi:hypothetical protein
VQVHAGDWGEVTRHMTAQYGICFAVLNMANAYVPGGAYVEGAIAQEENMFRRTDCHFRIDADEYDVATDRYLPEMTRLLSAHDGVVYLDKDRPRVCIRGPEDRASANMGYRWLPDEQVFPFFELRAAAQDLRDGSAFEPGELAHQSLSRSAACACAPWAGQASSVPGQTRKSETESGYVRFTPQSSPTERAIVRSEKCHERTFIVSAAVFGSA